MLLEKKTDPSAHRVLRRSPSAPQVKMLFHYHINDVHHQISFEDDLWCFVFGWSMAKSSGLWQNPWILPLITSMGFAMVPWKSPLHGEIHIPWFLPWYMAFTICNGFSHRIPKSHLDERCLSLVYDCCRFSVVFINCAAHYISFYFAIKLKHSLSFLSTAPRISSCGGSPQRSQTKYIVLFLLSS